MKLFIVFLFFLFFGCGLFFYYICFSGNIHCWGSMFEPVSTRSCSVCANSYHSVLTNFIPRLDVYRFSSRYFTIAFFIILCVVVLHREYPLPFLTTSQSFPLFSRFNIHAASRKGKIYTVHIYFVFHQLYNRTANFESPPLQ